MQRAPMFFPIPLPRPLDLVFCNQYTLSSGVTAMADV